MERRVEKEDSTRDSGSEVSIIESIRKLAAKNARAALDSEEQLLLFLQSWWSRTYNRPLKDPLLQSYSLEELIYEFYDRIERARAEEERLEQESVKIEEDKEREVLDWAEQEERREIELQNSKSKEDTNLKPIKNSYDPIKDKDNIAWMEQQIQNAKSIYGENFGEDIEDFFEE